MKYKYITPPQNCTGCGLCDNVCSHNAISMVWSKEGFLIPQVNTEACINCGLCSKQCIALEEKQEYTDDVGSVAAWGGLEQERIHASAKFKWWRLFCACRTYSGRRRMRVWRCVERQTYSHF